jgi:hypothetical protein
MAVAVVVEVAVAVSVARVVARAVARVVARAVARAVVGGSSFMINYYQVFILVKLSIILNFSYW